MNWQHVSTHTSLAGRDFLCCGYINSNMFLLTRPSRDVTYFCRICTLSNDVSTHTSLAGRDNGGNFLLLPERVSTHTSLAGRDELFQFFPFILRVSTHTSLAGRDCAGYSNLDILRKFLLTRPSRDVTISPDTNSPILEAFLLTRPSRDVTIFLRSYHPSRRVSTHTSLAGRDQIVSAQFIY